MGKLKACLVECDPSNTLGGSCLRDVKNMQKFLNPFTQEIQIFYHHERSRLLTYLDSLCLNDGDTFIFYLSGHGFGMKDGLGDETDHQDEYVMMKDGQLKDDLLYERIVLKHNRESIRLFLMADTCHSGTMFDLPRQFDPYSKRTTNITKRQDNLHVKAISLGACSDDQLSMCDIGNVSGFGGSLTVALLDNDTILQKLILTFDHAHSDIIKIFDRLKLLGQTGYLCIT